MNVLLSILSLLLCGFFAYNFNTIISKIRSGKIVNKLSLLATSSLILHFLSLTLYFIFNLEILVVLSETYMLFCLSYLLLKK